MLISLLGGTVMNQAPNNYSYDPNYAPAPTSDSNASTSMILGIIALVANFVGVGGLIPIILGALAMSFSKKSVEALGFECSNAKTGRICGMIGLIISIVGLVLAIVGLLLYFLFIFFVALLPALF